MSDRYQKFAEFYDDVFQSQKNYHEIATELAKIVGDYRDLLDIGIGTGLVVEHLLQIEPSYKITGIDNSRSLLEQAKRRLGQKVDLHYQSISELDIGKKFDVAYSRGGAWFMLVDNELKTTFGSHILSSVDIQKSFYCVAKHLKENGILIMGYSNLDSINLVKLDNNLCYQRIVDTELIENKLYANSNYSFYKDEELLAQQTVKLRLLSYQTVTTMLEKAGFVEKNIEPGKYSIYLKK